MPLLFLERLRGQNPDQKANGRFFDRFNRDAKINCSSTFMVTILLIEDNADIRENTIEMLEVGGFKVIAAEDGKAGLVAVNKQRPDIILCDIMMPKVDGYTVLKELKGNKDTASIPFIFVTASVEKKEVEAALAMGADGYIRKPYEMHELLDVLKEFLDKE